MYAPEGVRHSIRIAVLRSLSDDGLINYLRQTQRLDLRRLYA